MNYIADIYSTDVLCQTLRMLPNYLIRKWSEYSFHLRKREEPNLIHLENWLQARVMAAKDPYLPNGRDKRTGNGPRIQRTKMDDKSASCPCCNGSHFLYKCDSFKSKTDVEKLDLVKKKRLCFNCLNPGHGARKCLSKRTCFEKGCGKRHHTFIHQALSKKSQSQESEGEAPERTGVNIMRSNRKVFLQLVQVKVSNQNGDSVETYALLDSGSKCTIITKGLCDSVKLEGKVKKVNFVIKGAETMKSKVVDLNISPVDGSFKTDVENVCSLHENDFNMPGQIVPITEDLKWNYVNDICFFPKSNLNKFKS